MRMKGSSPALLVRKRTAAAMNTGGNQPPQRSTGGMKTGGRLPANASSTAKVRTGGKLPAQAAGGGVKMSTPTPAHRKPGPTKNYVPVSERKIPRNKAGFRDYKRMK